MRRAQLTVAAALAAAVAIGPAAADAIDDCRKAWGAHTRLAACSAVIASPAAPAADKAFAYRQRGATRLDAGALADAMSDLEEAVRQAPGDSTAHLLRGQAHVARNDLARAIDDLDEAVRLAPRSAAAFTSRGHTHMLRDATALAVADFTKAVELDPSSAAALNNLGLANRRNGNLDAAIADYTAAISINPVYALAYNNRGYTFEAKGDREAAIRDFAQALILDPGLSGARQGLERLKAAPLMTKESETAAAEGKMLLEKHCSRCHAIGPSGDSPNAKAPPFRLLHSRHPVTALREPLTRGIAAPHDEMPAFSLAPREIDRIVAYVNSLAPR